MDDAWMVTDRQYRRFMKLIQEEQTLATAAAKAGMDEKIARKYRDLKKLPSQTRRQRTWRTRKDAFEEAWPEVTERLERDETIEAKTIFEYLSRQHPERYQEGELVGAPIPQIFNLRGTVRPSSN